MPGIFFLVSDLGPCAAAKTLALAVPALAKRYRVAVGVLGEAGGPFGATLVAAGFPPVAMPVRGLYDAGRVAAARQWVRSFEPDVLHAVGPAAVRLAPILGSQSPRRKPRPIVVSAADQPGGGLRGWWTRGFLRGADQVIAATQSEVDRYNRLGVPYDRICVIPPGVPPTAPPPDPVEFRKALDIPADGRLVIVVGGFDATADLLSAVWAFDVLRYTLPDVYLVLVGDGPDRDRTERFARSLAFDDHRVRFAGLRSDVPALLTLAEVVWVTHSRGGIHLALEAMAAGRPVVAFDTPELSEVIEEEATGRLVAPGNRVEMAAATRELLADPDLAGRFGAAGKARTAERHSVSGMTDQYALLYERLLGG